MKKLYFALCAMLMSIGTLTANEYKNVLIDGIYYNLNDNYQIKVDGQTVYIQRAEVTSNPNKYSGNITIPDSVTYEGVKFEVQVIRENAFYQCSNLTRVVLPESITNIGSVAFYNCGSLLSVSLPNSLEYIGSEAFYNCSSLTAITIPSSITTIAAGAFNYCSNLREVYISDLAAWCKISFIYSSSNPLYYAGGRLYLNGKELTDVVIPEGITTLEKTFAGCKNINSVSLPAGFTTIGTSTFYYSSLESINIPEGVTTIGQYAFSECQSLRHIILPESLTNIDQYALYNSDNLTSIVIPDNVLSIENDVFKDCNNLSSVSIGANIANLSKDAFTNCTSLKSVNWNVTNFIDFAAYTLSPFYNFRSQITSFTFGENVQHIPAYMCYEMSNLSRIDIPASVKSVGDGAFAYCGRLTEINAAAGSPLYSSEDGVLFSKDKTSLIIYPAGKSATSYIVPSTVQTIEENAFNGCANLSSITIPASVTSIGAGNGTISMWSFEGSVPPAITNDAFPSDVYIIVDNAATYKAAWPQYASRIFQREYAEQTVNITAQADKSALHVAVGEENLANVLKLTISGSINSYDLMIMRNKMINLRELDLTDASIVANAYEYYTGLCSHADTLLAHSFRGLRSIKLPRTLKFAEQALIDCPDLKYAEFNGGVVGTQVAPYQGDGDLQVVLNEGVTEIKPYAFVPSELVHTYYGENSSIPNTKLRSISFPNSLGEIEDKRFWYCSNLIEVTLGDAISKIGDYAFCECKALTNIVLPFQLDTIGNHAFQATGIAQVTIPSKTKSIGDAAFLGLITDGGQTTLYTWNGTLLSLVDYDLVTNMNSSSNWIFMFNNDELHGSYLYIGNGSANYHYVQSTYALKKLTFAPNSQLKEIGQFAFGFCGIDSIAIPDNVAQIGQYAFIWDSRLKSITFGENSALQTIEKGVFQNTTALERLVLPGKLITIDELAFSSHRETDALAEVNFPTMVKSIDRAAFYGRKGLHRVMFPTSLQTIGDYAFNGCTSLDEIRVPSSLLSVGNYAFDNCSNVTKVYTYTVEPVSIDQNTFSCWRNADLYVPSTSYNNYFYNTQWSQFLSLKQFDEEYSYFYINNDYELGGNTGTIDGKPDADLNENSGLIITGDNAQEVGVITISGDDNGAASVIACTGNLKADELIIRLVTKKGNWSYFCFPFDVLLSQLNYKYQYIFKEYNGSLRAQYGAGGWVKFAGDVLQKGLGYIFQGAQTDTLEIRIPNPKISCEDYTQIIRAYGAEQAIHSNWNFIGNPFPSWYDIDALFDGGFSSPVYIWDANLHEYKVYRPGDDDYHFHPYEGFFTQNPKGQDVTVIWGSDGRETKLQADNKRQGHHASRQHARRVRQQQAERQLIDIRLASADYADRTRVVFNAKASTGYELGCDAVMMDGGEAPLHIWSIAPDNSRLAINERPYVTGEVALGYDVNEAGYYTLSAERMDKDVIIYDNVLKQEVDLSMGDYTFYTEAGTNTTRFGIARIKGQEQTTTVLSATEADEMVNVYTVLGMKLMDNVRRADLRLDVGVYVIEHKDGSRSELTIQR